MKKDPFLSLLKSFYMINTQRYNYPSFVTIKNSKGILRPNEYYVLIWFYFFNSKEKTYLVI